MDSWTASKAILFILIRAALLGGAVFSGLMVGALTYAIQRQTGSGAAPLFGLVSGVSVYLGGMAGREYLTTNLLGKLLPPKTK